MQTCVVLVSLAVALCCTVSEAVPVSEGCIASDNNRYPVGKEFIPKDCTRRCKCHEHEMISCVSLCPPVYVICSPGEVEETYDEPVPGSECTCPINRCRKIELQSLPMAEVCISPDNITYHVGERFITKDCTGRCTCNEHGMVSCVSLCPPAYVICSPGEVEETYDDPVPGSQCTCPTKRCRKVQPKFCVLPNGDKYPVNKTFVSKDCTARCRCNSDGVIECVDLCPTVFVKCKAGFKKEYYDEPVGDSGCSCKRARCIPLE